MFGFQSQGGRDGSKALKSKLVQPATNLLSHSLVDGYASSEDDIPFHSEGGVKIRELCVTHERHSALQTPFFLSCRTCSLPFSHGP